MRKFLSGLILVATVVLCTLPARTYYDDTHYGLTYFMARSCGYTSLQAHRLASADLSVDYSPRTEPEEYKRMARELVPLAPRPAGPAVGSEEPRVRFHAFRDDRNAATKADADAAIAQQAEQLWRLGLEQQNPGVFLHFLQDQPAHAGYGSAGGHWIPEIVPIPTSLVDSGKVFGSTTDFLSYKPERATGMVAATLAALERFRAAAIPLQRPRPCSVASIASLLSDLMRASPPPPIPPTNVAQVAVTVSAHPDYAKANLAVGLALRTDVRPFPDLRIDYIYEGRGSVSGLTAGSPNPIFGGSIENLASTALDAFTLRGALRATISSPTPIQVSIWAAPTRTGEEPYQLACGAASGAATFSGLPIGDLIVQTVAPGGTLTRQPVVLTRLVQDVAIRLPAETESSRTCGKRAAAPITQLCSLTSGVAPANVRDAQALERQINAQFDDLQSCMSSATVADAGSSFNEIQRQAAARTEALDRAVGAGQVGLDRWQALVAAAERGAKKEPELANAAGGAQAAVVIDQAKGAGDSAALHLGIAGKLRTEASAELALAQTAADPATKIVHYQQALDLLHQGENQARNAIGGFAPPKNERPTPQSEAFNQLKAIASALENAGADSQLGTLRAGFDGAAQQARDVVIVGPNTPFFSGAPLTYSAGTLTLGDGRRIDVTAVERAAAGTGTASSPPLFRPSPTPGGGFVVDSQAHNRAVAAAADPKVGGVALQVKLLALDAAGVPGFRGGTYLEGVDETVTISLQRVLTRVEPFASSAGQWASLPAELRFPGNIDRVIGYVIDAKREDIVIIGSPAKRPQARMDIDALILALRATWRDNQTPFVSLDPSPQNPTGPQLSRVGGGVPQDSVMAKTMLDADYLMKLLMLGKRPTEVAGYQSIAQLGLADPDALKHPGQARFWFYPKPLGFDAVSMSASGRTVTFNAELQVLTEQMATQGAAFVGTGVKGGVEEAAALGFTRALDALSMSTKTDPDASFARLRGLTGAVTLGALLRRAGVDFPVLHKLIALPYRKLAGAEAVPTSYPGVVTEFDIRRDGVVWRIALGGGVELVPRQRSAVRAASIDRLADHLEKQVDSGELQRRDAIREPNPTVLALARESGSVPKADARMVAGSTAFRDGDFGVAATEFRAAAAADPTSVDAYINLAFSLDRLGRSAEAGATIRTARLLEPADASALLIESAIRLRADKSGVLFTDTKIVRRIIELYTANAHHALRLQKSAQAVAWATDAIDLGSSQTPADAYLVRAQARLDDAPEQACKDLLVVADATEYVLSGGSYGNDSRLFALATMGLSRCMFDRQIPALERAGSNRAGIRAVAEALDVPIKLLEPVQTLLPLFSPNFISALRMEGLQFSLMKPDLSADPRAAEERRLSAKAAELVRRFPDTPEAYAALGELNVYFEKPERALEAANQGLQLQPTNMESLTVRATAFALLGRCAEARNDLSVLQRNPQFGAVPGQIESRCGK